MKKLSVVLLSFFMFCFTITAQNNDDAVFEEDNRPTLLSGLNLGKSDLLHILLDTRVDIEGSYSNGKVDKAQFRGHTLKIVFEGQPTHWLRYYVRHRFNKPQYPAREGYSDATDMVWLGFDINNRWSITAGKQGVQYGTFEYDYNAADTYLVTECGGTLDSYRIGLNVAYKLPNHTLNLQVMNSPSPDFSSEEYKDKAFSFHFLWAGSFWDGLVKTRWAVNTFQHDRKKFYNWITAGTQINIGKFTSELDCYTGNRNADYSAIVNDSTLTTRYVKDLSLSVNLKYDLGKWKPQLKGVWNKRKDKEFDKTAYLKSGIEAVVEFYPFKGIARNLRFHAMYAFTNTRFKGNFSDLSSQNQHTLLVGTRWLFDVK